MDSPSKNALKDAFLSQFIVIYGKYVINMLHYVINGQMTSGEKYFIPACVYIIYVFTYI